MFLRPASKDWLIGVVLLGLGSVATLLTTLHVRGNIEEEALRQFAFSADQVAIKVRERLGSYELILRGGAALFEADGRISRGGWRRFVEKLEAEKVVPGVQGIGFAQVIAADRLAAHVAEIRGEGFPHYSVRPDGQRELYSAIVYLEPFSGRNLRAFGYDMLTEPVRRAAMEQARDSGLAVLSGKVRLVQETETNVQPGVLMYVPVYRSGAPLQTIEQRRAALLGWVYSPYRMNDLMSGILKDWESQAGRYIDLEIYDGATAEPDNQIFNSFAGPGDASHSRFHLLRKIDFNGHVWLLEFGRIASAPALDYMPAWLTFAGGMGITTLLFYLFLSLRNTQRYAAHKAEELTATIRQREQLLRDSEFRWHFAVEGSGDGLWDWDVPAGTVFYSARWKEMLGYAHDEIDNRLDEWESRIHPDDHDRTLAAVHACLEGKTPLYTSEHRLCCKDGSYRWILDRGMLVSRSEDGKPLRMIGTHSDIDDFKRLEASLRQSEADLLEAQRIGQIGSWKLDFATNAIVWSATMSRMFGLDPQQPVPDLPQQRRFHTEESWEKLSAAIAHTRETGLPYELELEVIPVDGSPRWLLARGEAVRGADGTMTGLQGIAADITERRKAHMRIEQLGQLYAALSACNAAVAHCTTQEELFACICEIVVRQGGMAMAWVGLIDAATGRIVPVQSYGEGRDYLDGIEVSVRADDEHGRGPTGIAAREGRVMWVENFQAHAGTTPWRERAARFGWKASAALPIFLGGKPLGALTFYSKAEGYFDAEVRALQEEMAASISFALDKFAAEAEARAYQATLVESEQRFRSLVEQSIAGAFIIQDGQVSYANPRAWQILGYAGEADQQAHSPLDFIAPKDRKSVARLMRKLLDGELSRAETLFSALRSDGTIVEVGVNCARASFQSRPAIIGLMQDISDRKVAEDQITRYARRLEHTFFETVGLATTLSEMRDAYTAGHERRVAEIAVAIGKELGLDEARLEGLRVGGYLHDVGKITVPSEILSKPGKLTTVEYALIQQHAQAGYDVLKEVDFPWPVAQIAWQHHERIDGSGYPQGLKGEAIILEARITAVADVVESMASHRPYRPGLGIDKALAEIERGAGRVYDTEVARACLRLFREKSFVIPPQ